VATPRNTSRRSARLSKALIKMGSTAAIILAAGASLRLGTPKQLVRLGGETLLERTVRIALEAGLNPVLGVVPPDLRIEPSPSGMTRIVNPLAVEGMATSIGTGLRALAASVTISGAIILACDQPAVTAKHLRELANGAGEIVASAYSGRKGIPAYFPSAVFQALLALRGDLGARDLIQNARAVPLPGGDLDVDTIEDLDRARKLYTP
jgi:molybdenum cofactor cytidylyltransferase